MNKDDLDKICNRISTYDEEAVDLQKELTAIPALAPENDGEGEKKKSDFLESYLRQTLKCDEVNRYDAPDDRVPSGSRPNLVAKINGKNTLGTVWIMSHMDVVPAGDLSQWQGDPWTIRVEDGKIYGRGCEDNQQGIVSSLLAAKAFRDEGIIPEKTIGLIFVSDEETGNEFGIQHLIKNHKELFKPSDFFIVPDAGNAEGTLVEVAEKSILWLKFKVQGKQTHASTPELGVNAHTAGSNLVVKLGELYALYPNKNEVFEPPKSTFEPTKREANVPNVNTIPGEDLFYVDCRVLPEYDIEEIKSNIAKICTEVEQTHNVKIVFTTALELKAASPTPTDAPVVLALQQALLELRGIKTTAKGIGGGTVAAFFREAGFNTVVWATQDETLHEPNEYVKIENLLKDAKVFAHIALQR